MEQFGGQGRDGHRHLIRHWMGPLPQPRQSRLPGCREEINGSISLEPSAIRYMAIQLDVIEHGSTYRGRGRHLAGSMGGVHSPLDWSEEDWNTNIDA
ncbi:hypothetical protein Cni_G09783 [Canna indica]|uniref:Uncharacterized protein n=1 Tax=Canna indica TaxID=4628 RepID=A0AAQ3K4Y6_9LILI|nr:hypothetical protein Cni_G09783 [Canna indica]